jgi:SPP1 family phage portal protein
LANRPDRFGRQIIYSSASVINETNIIEELNKAISMHILNEAEIKYLEEYYTGRQPILERVKEVRPDINNKIVENHALEIVEFMTAQNFGEPVQYVRRGNDEKKSIEIQKLNDYMYSENKAYYDVELGRWKSICGTSYRVCYPDDVENKLALDESPFGIDVLRPQDTFVVYSSDIGHKPLMGVHRIETDIGEYIYQCYTPVMYCECDRKKILPGKTKANGIGRVLIVEYPNNSRRLSDIEIVMSLLDSINKIQSNRMDGIEQFIQAFMKFVNCDIDEDKFLEMCHLGAIKIKDNGSSKSDVEMMSNELNQTQVQVAKDDLYSNALKILAMPDREQNTGGDTGQAVYLRNGWDFAEKRAEINELPIEKSEKEFLKIVLTILNTNEVTNLKISDIEIKFTRSKTDNMVVKTQALMNQLAAGINPQIAIKTCGLYSDPEDVYIKSSKVMESKYGEKSIENKKVVATENSLEKVS